MNINVDQVPQSLRTHPEFLRILHGMQRDLGVPGFVDSVCIHEAAHVLLISQLCDPSTEITFIPSYITHDGGDKFSGYTASVKLPTDVRAKASLDVQTQFQLAAQIYAAGGVATRKLSGGFGPGDEEDRNLFTAFCQRLGITDSEVYWQQACAQLEEYVSRPAVQTAIRNLAASIKPSSLW